MCAIDPKQKLSVMDILKLIYKIDSKIFNDDKILISIFDEVAMLNGYSYESLPQRKTIIRQKYKLEEEYRSQCLDNELSNSGQLKLDF